MGYVSLYRKYRPDTFDKIIGQDHIVRTLSNQIKSGNVAHAYLFTGTRGTGKTSVARIFAKAVNCIDPQQGSPCGKCRICSELNDPNHIDIIEIDAASNNSVDDIRDLREKVSYAPSKTKYKVYIIDEVHQLSPSAFNALLKTLEEPPSYVIFILATTEVHKIPQTILSRCIKFDFRLVPIDSIANHLKHIFESENVKYTSEAVLAIARSGEGSVRDALSVADMCLSYSESNITYEKVLEVLGANDPTAVIGITEMLLDGDLKAALNAVENSAALGRSMPVLARDITKTLRDFLIIKAENSPNDILKLPDKVYEAAKNAASRFDSIKILRALEIFSNSDTMMKYSTFPRIILETAISKAATLEGGEALDLLAKINDLEHKISLNTVVNKASVKTETKIQTKTVVNTSIDDDKNQKIEEEKVASVKIDSFEKNDSNIERTAQNPSELIELDNIPEDWELSEVLNKSEKAEMTKLKGNLVKALREKKAVMMSIMVGDDNTAVKITDNTVTILIAKQSDLEFIQVNIATLKSAADELLNGDCKIKLELCPDHTEEGLKKIIELFGNTNVTIKNN